MSPRRASTSYRTSRTLPEIPGAGSGRERIDYYRRMFEEAPAAYIVTDPRSVVMDANRAATTILSRPLSAIQQKPFSLFVALSDRPTFATIVRDILTSPFEMSRPLCMKPKRGADIDMIFRAALIRTPEGAPQFILWILVEAPDGSRDLL